MPRLIYAAALAALTAFFAAGCHQNTASAPPLPGSPHPAYAIADIGVGWPSGLNNKEQAVGLSPTFKPNVGFRGFLWSKGQRTEMPTFGGRFSDAVSISDGGIVVGGAAVPNFTPQGVPETHTCLWQNGKLTDLESDPRFYKAIYLHLTASGSLYAVYTRKGKHGEKHLWFYPGGFSSGRGRDLGSLGGDDVTVSAVSDTGLVVGSKGNNLGPRHAFLWQRGCMTLIKTPGEQSSGAVGVNNAGQVVGNADMAANPNLRAFGFGSHAFLWEHGKMHELGPLPGGVSSHAYAINNSGTVVGFSSDQPTPQKPYLASEAVLWKNGRITALSPLISARTAWWSLSEARNINDQGQIIGSGFLATDRQGHGYLLTPMRDNGDSYGH